MDTLGQVAEFLNISSEPFSKIDTAPKHQSVGQHYLKSPVVEKWVSADFFDTVRKFVPASIRQPIRYRFFSNQLNEAPEFSPKLKSLLWQLLVDDVTAVEEMMGRSLEVWREEYDW